MPYLGRSARAFSLVEQCFYFAEPDLLANATPL